MAIRKQNEKQGQSSINTNPNTLNNPDRGAVGNRSELRAIPRQHPNLLTLLRHAQARFGYNITTQDRQR